MSSTRDWMRGGEEQERPVRQGLPLGLVALWALGLVIVANAAVALQHLMG
jgi:hypothetical protein